MEEWVIDSSAGIVPVYTCSCSTGCSVRLSSVSSSSFFSSSPRHVSPRIVVRGSWMPDDYIDRVGGWSEASKVAANFAIRRNTTSTKKYLLLARGVVPWYRFHRSHAKFSLSPRVISPAWIFLSRFFFANNSLFLPTIFSLSKEVLSNWWINTSCVYIYIHLLDLLYFNNLNISEIKYFLFE